MQNEGAATYLYMRFIILLAVQGVIPTSRRGICLKINEKRRKTQKIKADFGFCVTNTVFDLF